MYLYYQNDPVYNVCELSLLRYKRVSLTDSWSNWPYQKLTIIK